MDTILIIDDTESNVRLFTDILEFHGFKVITAMTGTEGYRKASEKVDLILLDLQLPDMDGLEVAKEIRANPDIADTPIIAVTSYAMEEDREKALAAGCCEYLTKPIDVRLMIETVKNHLASDEKGS
jgi:two-component system cell cycle response regulator DivK